MSSEECDDLNVLNGDGCSSTCNVEEYWECTGSPSKCKPECGDGVVFLTEVCDDGD